jgi:O-antigen/teichoic acid export membrane protein
MNRLRRVIGNTVISLLGQGVTWTSTLVLTVAYGRFLGDVKLGELFFAMTFVALIGFPIDAGFNQQLTRDVAQDQSKALRYLTNILFFKLILWLFLYGCILLLCWRLGYPREVRTLIIICGITLLCTSLSTLMSGLHYAFERVVFPVVGNILEKGLSALVGCILLAHGASVQIMAVVLFGSACTNMLWQSAWAIRRVGIPWAIDVPLARKLLRKSIPFILYGVLGVIYYRIDTILLSFMASIAVIGWYGAAYRIFDTLVFLPSLVISAIMYPVFSKLTVHSQSELKVAIEKALNFLLFCCIPISTGLIVAAPNVIGTLYHRAEFVNAIPAMQALAPGLFFLYINSVLTSVMISTGRERKITIMAGIALVFNLGLNLLLIPQYQHVGAALVTSLTELLLTIFALLFIPRSLWPIGSIKVGLKALLAGVVMGIAVWFMQQYDPLNNLLAIVPASAVVYFGTATLLGTIPREDMKALYTSIRHKAERKQHISENVEQTEEEISSLEEEIQQEQDFVFALGFEMTNPSLPAYKYEMTRPLVPTSTKYDFGDETIILPKVMRQILGKNISAPSKIEDEEDEDTVPRKAIRPTKKEDTTELLK